MPLGRAARLPFAYDLVGRALLALPFLSAGLSRLLHPQAAIETLSGAGLAYPEALSYAAAAIELIGGACVLIGFQVWTACVALVVYLVPATFVLHGLPAHESPAHAGEALRGMAIAGGLLLLAGVHRREGERAA